VTLGASRSARRAGRGAALTLTATPVAGRADAIDFQSTFRVGTALVDEHAITVAFDSWSRDNYVTLPGLCYAGNRFQSRRAAYPPLLTERADIGPHVPPIVPDIARLSPGPSRSALSVEAGDLATPAVAIQLPASRLGIIVLTRATAAGGPVTLTLAESDDRTRATLAVGTRGRDQIPARIYIFDCADVPALFERLYGLRKELTGPTPLVHDRPFSAMFAAHEARVNDRWLEKPGILAAGRAHDGGHDLADRVVRRAGDDAALIAAGTKTSRERALATVAYVVDGGQARSGFFHGISDGKTWSEDGFTHKHARRWHLVRRTAETLTLLVKQLALIERHPELGRGAESPRWIESARHAADALCKLWERQKQLGQFVDIDSGDLIVGGSTSAGLAPAGLALAAGPLKEPRYLATAKAIGEHYYERFVRVGLTSGGPGDVLQAPDSQSAAALLDSFVTLYEITRDAAWNRSCPRRRPPAGELGRRV
jgi:hypothetical protein